MKTILFIIIILFTQNLFSEENNIIVINPHNSIGFSTNLNVLNDDDVGYFSKTNAFPQFALFYNLFLTENIISGIELPLIKTGEDNNSFFQYGINITTTYNYNFFKYLGVFCKGLIGYGRTSLIIEDNEIDTQNSIQAALSVGSSITIKNQKTNSFFGFSFEFGYKYSTDLDMNFKKENRNIDYGQLSLSGFIYNFSVFYKF